MRDNIGYMTTGNLMPCMTGAPKVGLTVNFANNRLSDPEKVRGYTWHDDPFAALMFSEIHTALHRVSYGGDTEPTRSGGISSEVTILATVNIRKIAVALASEYALSVAHLWNAPEFVIERLNKPPSEELWTESTLFTCKVMEDALQPARDAHEKGLPISPEMTAQCCAVFSARQAMRCKTNNFMDDAGDAIIAAAQALDPRPFSDNDALAAARAEFNRRVYAAFEELDNA